MRSIDTHHVDHFCFLKQGGDAVIWSYAPDGQTLHQLNDRFGTDFGGRQFKPGRILKPQEKAARLIFVAPYLSKYERDAVCLPEKFVHCRDWGEALAELVSKNGPGTKVGVYPYVPIQMPEKAAQWC
jgi:hypothetical protein